MDNKGNRYDDKFKADAMSLVREGGRSVNKVAKDLGINPQTLRNCSNTKIIQRMNIYESNPCEYALFLYNTA